MYYTYNNDQINQPLETRLRCILYSVCDVRYVYILITHPEPKRQSVSALRPSMIKVLKNVWTPKRIL